VERRSKALGTAEEDSGFGGRVDFADRFENHVPVGAAEVGGCAETGDGVLFGVGIVDHDVGCVVGLDLGGKVLFGTVSVCLCLVWWWRELTV
jgi:hypothetical protein